MNVTGDYWQHDQPEAHVLPIIGVTPKRWGRMDYASRIAIVEVGFLLGEANLLNNDNLLAPEIKAGLIVGTRKGSLLTDLHFCQGLKENSETASPLLFSYTLPNVPLAEAANQYQIKGPIFSMYSETPYNTAIEEGRRWVENDASISFIIAGELDCYPENDDSLNKFKISANFTIIQ
jgi:3-oxoacyl-(acyl-carrier-protein) synthase